MNYRIFRVYLAGAIQGFRDNTYNLNQSLVIECGNQPADLPLTRKDVYVPR